MFRIILSAFIPILLTATAAADSSTEMRQARNRQDHAALDKLIGTLKTQSNAEYHSGSGLFLCSGGRHGTA